MTTRQNLYIRLVKRPVGFLGALAAILVTSPVLLGTMVVLFFANKNGLKGDMAFIGPRPLLVQYLPLYSEEQHHGYDVTPGMRGWAQVNGRNNISWTKKFEYDLYYVQHIGLAMDVKVFFTTVKKVFGREDINTSTGQSATMDFFDGTN